MEDEHWPGGRWKVEDGRRKNVSRQSTQISNSAPSQYQSTLSEKWEEKVV
jgi:hypothetical protein